MPLRLSLDKARKLYKTETNSSEVTLVEPAPKPAKATGFGKPKMTWKEARKVANSDTNWEARACE
ncbi:hypothetical protein PT974_01944 [Cladobotryum mycophilum]|uniref:Multiprotein-bridging factor 1 n=1 Tax=Cladobotryum mycophilum TaxID=491253 RepID=A0ABR0SWW0_9HYPO